MSSPIQTCPICAPGPCEAKRPKTPPSLAPDFYRISSLASLSKCPSFSLMSNLRESGKAADTGTGVGRLCELFHRLGDANAATVQATLEHPHHFPLADMTEVVQIAARYCEDPRNWRQDSPIGLVIPEHCELTVEISLPPDEADPTGRPVVLRGHVDQIRRDPTGVLRVWDIKNTVRLGGVDALYTYAWQISAYCLAATETLGEMVMPGGIIRTRSYLGRINAKKPAEQCSVFFDAPWGVEQCRDMVDHAVYLIGQMRAGLVSATPGLHCHYCPGQGPHVCGDRLDEILPQSINPVAGIDPAGKAQ